MIADERASLQRFHLCSARTFRQVQAGNLTRVDSRQLIGALPGPAVPEPDVVVHVPAHNARPAVGAKGRARRRPRDHRH